jgi:hypothetical protein
VLVDTAGLLPTMAGARVRLEGGRISISEGPFRSNQEVVGGYAIFDVSTKQEAIKWAERFMDVHRLHWNGEGETEVRQVIQQPDAGAGAPRG